MKNVKDAISEFDKGYEHGKSKGITDIFYEIAENSNFN